MIEEHSIDEAGVIPTIIEEVNIIKEEMNKGNKNATDKVEDKSIDDSGEIPTSANEAVIIIEEKNSGNKEDKETETNKVENNTKCFTCKVCKNIFSSLKCFGTHTTKCVEEFSCMICMKTFKSKKSFQQHLKNMHVKVKRCESCIETFSTERNLLKHMIRNHKAGQEIKCGTCSTVFKTRKSYSVHKAKKICGSKEKSILEKESENSVCEKGNEKDKDETHEKICASIQVTKKTFQCEKCPKGFKSDRGLRAHKQTHKILSPETNMGGGGES
jgi:uncharacterized C2H2 Zn-finger protein